MVPMVVIMAAIFFLSHQPADDLYIPLIPGADKVAHVVMYGVLAASVLYAFNARRLKDEGIVLAAFLTVNICILYGIGDEFHQSFIPGRFSSFADVAADAAGAAMVCVAWLLWKRRAGQADRPPMENRK